MRRSRTPFLFCPLFLAALTIGIWACTPDESHSMQKTSTTPLATRVINTAAPGIPELLNATYNGMTQSPVTLTEGLWQGDNFISGGASRPQIGLVTDFYLSGDLNNDGINESVVLLWSNSGGSGTFDYLAVMGRDAVGEPHNLATTALGDRVKLRSAEIVDGELIINVLEAGSDDAACCPGQKMQYSFALEGHMFSKTSAKDSGRLSIADLTGSKWFLQNLDPSEPLPASVNMTLVFSGLHISGDSGCNRYAGNVTEGDTPGSLQVAIPMAATMMACPAPAMELEQRYLKALQLVSRFSYRAGKLILTWHDLSQSGTLVFTVNTQ